MATFEFDDHGSAAEVARALSRGGAEIGAKAFVLVQHFGVRLQTKVKANASGRPGPNAPTGDYRRSIALQVGRKGASIGAEVGTNKPQGRRLEFGFKGTDSLGRRYDQDPLPHFGPAIDALEPQFERAVAELVDGVLDDSKLRGPIEREGDLRGRFI